MARDFAQSECDSGVQYLLPRRGGWHRRMPAVAAGGQVNQETEAQKMKGVDISHYQKGLTIKQIKDAERKKHDQ